MLGFEIRVGLLDLFGFGFWVEMSDFDFGIHVSLEFEELTHDRISAT